MAIFKFRFKKKKEEEPLQTEIKNDEIKEEQAQEIKQEVEKKEIEHIKPIIIKREKKIIGDGLLWNLKASSDIIKDYYLKIRELLSHYKLHYIASNKSDVYATRGKTLLRISADKKSLRCYFAIEALNLEERFHIIDVKEKKKYEKTPSLLKIKSERSYKHFLEIFNLLIKEKEIKEDEKEFVDIKEMLEATSKDILVHLVGEEVLMNSCAKENANKISDSVAYKATLLKKTDRIKDRVVGSISIGELSAAFKSTYVIDLDLLKKVGLIEENVNYLIVTANNRCYKKTTIIANKFEKEAIKMILLTGGNPIKLY